MQYLGHNQIAEELMTKWSELEPERCSKVKGQCSGYFYQINYNQPHKGRRHWDFDFDFNPSRFRNEQYQFALLHWMLYEAICDRNWKASSTISSEGIQVTVTATFSTNTCSHPNPAIALLQAYLECLEFTAKISS